MGGITLFLKIFNSAFILYTDMMVGANELQLHTILVRKVLMVLLIKRNRI